MVLKDIAFYVDDSISSDLIELNQYVTTDSLLQNKEGRILPSNLPPQACSLTHFMPGDVLVANIRPYLKKVWKADIEGGCSKDVLVIRAKENHSAEFIYALSLQDNFFENAMLGNKGTQMPRGDKDKIMEFPVYCHDQIEEKKIGSLIDEIQNKIDINTRMNAELEAMAKQLYDYWFVQFDFPDENGNPYKSSGGKMVYNGKLKREIPEGWDDKQISDIAHIIAGKDCPKNFSLTKSSTYSIPIYSNGIDNNGLYGYTDKSTSPARSVTVSARGTIGYPILRHEPFVPIIRLIVATPYDEGADLYLYEYLRVIIIKNTGSVQPQLPVPEFSMITIPYPKNRQIIKSFSKLTRKWYITIEQNRKYNEYLTHIRDSLLPMLMNGQVTVE